MLSFRAEGHRGTKAAARRVSRPARPRRCRSEREQVAVQPAAVQQKKGRTVFWKECCYAAAAAVLPSPENNLYMYTSPLPIQCSTFARRETEARKVLRAVFRAQSGRGRGA